MWLSESETSVSWSKRPQTTFIGQRPFQTKNIQQEGMASLEKNRRHVVPGTNVGLDRFAFQEMGVLFGLFIFTLTVFTYHLSSVFMLFEVCWRIKCAPTRACFGW